MRRYSPVYYSPPRRGYGGRGRSPPRGGYSPPRRGYSPSRRGYSPPRRGYDGRYGGGGGGDGGGGGYRRRKESSHGSVLVRNIPLDCRPEELRIPFERFGIIRDVYIPKDYYTGEPRGFAFVQFVDSHDASEAQYHMNGQIFAGREITVVLAAESRKKPEEMRRKTRQRSGGPRYGGRRSPHRRSRSRSVSLSRPPRHHSGSRGGHHSSSRSGSPRKRDEYSASPSRRPVDRSRSPRVSPHDEEPQKSYSPKYNSRDETANGFDKYVVNCICFPSDMYFRKSKYEDEDEDEDAGGSRDSPGRLSRSPSGSRSRSADASPWPSR